MQVGMWVGDSCNTQLELHLDWLMAGKPTNLACTRSNRWILRVSHGTCAGARRMLCVTSTAAATAMLPC